MSENKEIPVLFIKMLSSKSSLLFRINRRQCEVPPEALFSFQSGKRSTSQNFLLSPDCYQKVCPLTDSLFIFPLNLTLSSLYGVGWGIKIWLPLVTAAVAAQWSMMPGYVISLLLSCLLWDIFKTDAVQRKIKKVHN